MSLVDEVMARIADQVPELHGEIDDAAALGAVTEPGQAPHRSTAFVLLLGEQGAPSTVASFHRQRIVATVAVVLAVRVAGDRRGAKAMDRAEPLVTAVITALAGWQPASAASPMDYRRRAIAGLRAGLVLVQLDFSTDWYLRGQSNG